MNPQDTKLSLRVVHPTKELKSFCSILGFVPTHIWKVGDERQTPKGRKIGGVREQSYCLIEFGEKSKHALSEKIKSALKILMKNKNILREISSTGGFISFDISWFCKKDTGESFDLEIMDMMRELSITFDFFIYVVGQDED